MTRSEAIVQVHHLSKRFKRTQALDQVSIDFTQGHIVGLLGANGAGKSTLLRHLIGMYLPDEGACTTFGVDAGHLDPATMARIGYVHQEGQLIYWMSCEQLIRYVAAHYPHWNCAIEDRYVSDFEIDRKQRVGKMSPGQRQKLAILLAIGHEPELLILDEPASGLDPVARVQFLDLLLEIILQEQRTILISSHILSDVEKVIDQVVVMDGGQIIEDCALDTLRERYCRLRVSALEGDLPDRLPFEGILGIERQGQQALVTIKQGDVDLLRSQATDAKCDIELQTLPLEDLYRVTLKQTQSSRKVGA